MRLCALMPGSCMYRWVDAAVTEDGRPCPLLDAILGLINLGPRIEDDAPQAAPAQLVKHLRTDAAGLLGLTLSQDHA